MTQNGHTVVLALVGKGGVGKTSLAALTVRLLSQAHSDKRILAIDADPAVGLATALGVEIGATVDDIRKAFVVNAVYVSVLLQGDAVCHYLDVVQEMGMPGDVCPMPARRQGGKLWD